MKKLLLILILILSLVGCQEKTREVLVEGIIVEVVNERTCGIIRCDYTSSFIIDYNGRLIEVVNPYHSTDKKVGDIFYFYIPYDEVENGD
jgi:hypothetical protein